MKVLLVAACLLAVASAQEESSMEPGARRGTFLYGIQEMLINATRTFFPDGENMMQAIKLGVMTAKNDLCKINNYQEVNNPQDHNSIILGKTCKKAFVKLYNEEPDRCGGVFCDVLTDFETKIKESLTSMIAAEYDDDFFDIIEERFIDPIMKYSCKCSGKMMEAWMGCKKRIGDADIWFTLMNFGGFDTAAEYLDGADWKEFWVNLVANRVPWEDIETMLARTMANLCQRNTDIRKGDSQCYTYFYNAFNTLYQAYMKSTGLTPAKRGRGGKSDVPEECTTYDLSEFEGVSVMNLTFGDIKEAVVDKFCVEECADFYQDEFLGCCTASMVKDEALEQSVKNVADEIKKIYVSVFPEDEAAADAGITEYVGYYNDAIDMMRDPTCDETSVSYDMTPCTEGDMSVDGEDPCAGLSGKEAKKCKKKQKKKGGSGDDSAADCAGLSGKKLKKCQKNAKKGGDSAAADCEGLSGKQLKKCKKNAKKGKN